MSVVLQGNGRISAHDTLVWDGKWQFTKDTKKTDYSFEYKRVSDEVPRDLLNYVSFTPVEGAVRLRGRVRGRGGRNMGGRGGRGRGRQPQTTLESIQTTVIGLDAIDGDVDYGDQECNMSYHHDEREDGNLKESNNSEVIEGEAEVHDEMQIEFQPAATEKCNEGVKIACIHEYLGFWEGGFIPTSQASTAEPETFFFHSILGRDPQPELCDLPPEPNFSYTVLRRPDVNSTLLQSSYFSRHVIPSLGPNAAAIFSKTPKFSGDGAVHRSQYAEDDSDELGAQGDGSSSAALSSAAYHDHMDGAVGAPQPDIPAAAASPTTVRPASVEQPAGAIDGQIVLVGFGRNRFGRFSLTAALNEKTGFLLCEKKYITSKYGNVKRPRPSDGDELVVEGGGHALSPSGEPVLATVAAAKSASSSREVPATRIRVRQGSVADISPSSATVDSTIAGAGTAATAVAAAATAPAGSAASAPALASAAVAGMGNIESTRSKSATGAAAVAVKAEDCDAAPLAKRRRISGMKVKVPTAGPSSGLDLDRSNSSAEKAKSNSALSSTKSSKGNAAAAAVAMLTADDEAVAAEEEEGESEGEEEVDDDEYRHAFVDEETGEIYEGGWYGGKRQGYGVCLFTDGMLYEGAWQLGKETGYGKLLTGDRQLVYSGEWLEGYMHGQGTYYFPNGDRYDGDWKEGARHGRGEYTLQSRCNYSGDWRDNRRHGKGVFTWPDGSVYEGDWEGNCRQGRGVLHLTSGFRYDGSWVNNAFEGRGVAGFPDGQEYQGSYKGGYREGRGSIVFAEGAVYEGRFRDDNIDGQGTVKVTKPVPGPEAGEKLVPIQIQADMRRIHLRAGFGDEGHGH